MCVYVYIYILILLYHPYIHIIILIIIYYPILATICTLCEAPESNNIDSGAIQINCIIIINIVQTYFKADRSIMVLVKRVEYVMRICI